MNNLVCSPGQEKHFIKTGTCFSKKSLIKIIKSYNDFNDNDKIKYNKSMKTKDLWNLINDKFSNKFHKEQEWLNHEYIKNNTELREKLSKNFKPLKPKEWEKNKYAWLSTGDINSVMKQYEDKEDNFYFVGVFPINFDSKNSFGKCISQELCDINIEKLKKNNISKIGIVFNLDRHDQPGSHWVSLYIDLFKGAYFFDSNGSIKVPTSIMKFMRILKNKSNNKGFEIKWNPVRHQFENSECGIFSMFFLIKMIEDNNFDKLINSNFKDKDMNQLRDVLYRPRTSK